MVGKLLLVPQSEVKQLQAHMEFRWQKQGFTVQHESKSHFSHSTFSRCNRALPSFLNAAPLWLNWSGSECAANANITYLNLLVALSTWGCLHTQRSAQIFKQNSDSEGFCGGMLGNKTWQPEWEDSGVLECRHVLFQEDRAAFTPETLPFQVWKMADVRNLERHNMLGHVCLIWSVNTKASPVTSWSKKIQHIVPKSELFLRINDN